MQRLVAAFFEIPAVWVVASVYFVSALETAVILGLFLPGGLVIVLGGVLAARGQVPLTAVLAAGVAGPISGDVTGYFLGRRYGEEIVRRKLGRNRWDRAHRRLSKKSGGLAIFFDYERMLKVADRISIGLALVLGVAWLWRRRRAKPERR